jgi:hypothetical protein
MDAALAFVQAMKPLYREEASIRASDLRNEGTAGTEPSLNQEILDWQYFFSVEGERTFKAKSSASRIDVGATIHVINESIHGTPHCHQQEAHVIRLCRDRQSDPPT